MVRSFSELRSRRGLLLTAVALVLTLLPARASKAAVPGLNLTWLAPSGCSSQADVERRVQALLVGHTRQGRRALDARVVVIKEPSAPFHAVVTTGTDGRLGTRTLEAESCTAIAIATAVVLVLSLDPSVALSELPADAQHEVTRPAPEPEEARRPAPPRTSFNPYLHAFGGVAIRVLPRASAFLGLGGGLRRGRWRFEVGAAWAAKQTLRLRYPDGAHADIGYWWLPGRGCYLPVRTRSVDLAACAGVAFEYWSAQAFGVSSPGRAVVALLSSQLSLESQVLLASPLSFSFGAQGSFRHLHPHFLVGDVGQVHEIPALSGALLAGLLLRL